MTLTFNAKYLKVCYILYNFVICQWIDLQCLGICLLVDTSLTLTIILQMTLASKASVWIFTVFGYDKIELCHLFMDLINIYVIHLSVNVI